MGTGQETDSGDEDDGEGKGRDDQRGRGGDGHDSGKTVDNRDETMGVSLGPVAQGHIVGVRCVRANESLHPSLLLQECNKFLQFLRVLGLRCPGSFGGSGANTPRIKDGGVWLQSCV